MGEDKTAAERKRRERERVLERLRSEVRDLVLEDTLDAWDRVLPALGLSCLVQIQDALREAWGLPRREEVSKS